jgi:hypothetical protein
MAFLAAFIASPASAEWPVGVPVCTSTGIVEAGAMVTPGDVFEVVVEACAEGGQMVTVNGRLHARDVTPDDRCTGYWRDGAMLHDGKPLVAAQWGAPDWQYKASNYQGCPQPG